MAFIQMKLNNNRYNLEMHSDSKKLFFLILSVSAGHGGSSLSSQHFGKPKWEDHLRSGIRDQPGQHGETLSLLKIQEKKKISWVGWCIPVIPATQEAEAGESLESRRWSLQ